jgi:lipase
MSPAQTRLILNGNEIAVYEYAGAEPAILFAHATGFHARCWDTVIARLPGRRSIALDFHGHGRSAKPDPPYRWRAFGEELAALVRRLNLENALGVGHSMGGHALTLAAALCPAAFASVLLLDPVILPEEAYGSDAGNYEYVARRRNHWKSPQEMFQRFRERAPFQYWDVEALRDYCEHGLAPAADGNGFTLACPPAIEAAIYPNSAAPESNIYAEIARVEAPTTVVRAGRPAPPDSFERSITAPDLASRFRRGRDVVLIERSHFIPMEAPALVAGMIRDYLPK